MTLAPTTPIPTAVVTGVAVLLAGSLPWGLLARMSGLGARELPPGGLVPWAVVPMAMYLWAYWRYIGGTWGASSDAADRRARLRANPLPPGLWIPALGAGLAGFATLLALLSLASRLVALPASAGIITPPGMPAATVVLLLVMQSIVAGVTEEAAFRGYMQTPIERRHGLALAILVNGTAFGLLHFPSHPRDVLLMLPYYVAVAAVYGGLTWAADSILPAVVLHAAGDAIVLTRWWATGLPEWQLLETAPPLVWARGVDTGFLVTAALLALLAVVTTAAFRSVRRLRLSTTS